jgi:hypothetical protein
MAADQLYYGGILDAYGFIETFYDIIKVWQDNNLDNQMARQLIAFRGLSETTEEYEVQRLDISGEEARPQAKSEPGNNISVGMGTEFAKIWRWALGFELNEDDLKKDPRLQGWHIEAILSKIYRAEDKAFINGIATKGISGLLTYARANEKGKIVDTGASGANINNVGAWLTSDTNRDIYQDILNARGMLRGKYQSNLRNIFLVGNAKSLAALDQKDPYSDNSTPISASVAPLLGRTANEPVTSWKFINDQIADNYVYLIVKNAEVAELLEARAIFIDDNYARKPIGNLEVQIFEDVGISIKDAQGYVEINIA